MNKKIQVLRVVFIFKNFGLIKGISHIGLGVAAANTSETLKQNGIDAEVWSILTVNDLILQLRRVSQDSSIKPITHIVISAPWVPTIILAKLITQYPQIKFIVISHSNVGFLAADKNGIRMLREYTILQNSVQNLQVAGNSKRFSDWATIAWDANIVFLPNLYNIKDMKFINKPWGEEAPLKIGCFGAIRPLKNQITAAAAALEIAKKLDIPTELWFNSGRNEGGTFASLDTIKQLVGNIHHFRIRHMPWAQWQDFRRFVGTMHLNLQPSYTESFNMVAADSIYESVPVVGSQAITWLPDDWIGNNDDANELADIGIKLLYASYPAYEGQKALKKYVKNGIKYWKKTLLK